LALRINGRVVEPGSSPGATLLTLIRETLGLKGTKESCGRGECGACTVLVNGQPVMSCIQFAAVTDGDVTTIEGLAEESRDLREAFAEFGGFQCGFCTAGQVVHATAVLRELTMHPAKDPETFVRHRLSGNICRCTGYNGIVDAVLQTHRRRVSSRKESRVP
jgi:carbon-monoxide dehydrogenase small subunit/xanthine dehydrogenase YagT iron-sulfur-binding subunit